MAFGMLESTMRRLQVSRRSDRTVYVKIEQLLPVHHERVPLQAIGVERRRHRCASKAGRSAWPESAASPMNGRL